MGLDNHCGLQMVIGQDTDLSELGNFQKIVRIAKWHRSFTQSKGDLPSRRDIDPTEFPEILGYQMISELHRDRRDGRIRMLGTVAERFSGLSTKASGRWFSDVLNEDSTHQAVTACSVAMDLGQPIFGYSQYLKKDGQRVGYARLICPLQKLADEPETLFTVFELIPGDGEMKAALISKGII